MDRTAILLFFTALTVYLCTMYGGIRSPDSEVVFRTAEALLQQGSFNIQYLDSWPYFGVSPSQDGSQYGIFGPLLSILLIPLLALAHWYPEWAVQLSPYAELNGMAMLLYDLPPEMPERHQIRGSASLLNPFLASCTVVAVYRLVKQLYQSSSSGLLVAVLFGFATPFWSYSGTLFSEVLTTLCVVQMMRCVLADPTKDLQGGLWLGAAVLSHLSSILFVPVVGWLVWRQERSSLLRTALGPVLALTLLGLYNVFRFGSVMETGRSVLSAETMAEHGLMYGQFVSPIVGLYGLLVGAGKGVFVFAPMVFCALFGWSAFRAKQPRLAMFVAMTVGLRLLFFSARSDWHGGISLGPRYLIPLLPLLMLPLVHCASKRVLLAVFAVGCIVQQAYFAVGNIFVYDATLLALMDAGRLPQTSIHLDWEISPVFRLHEVGVGASIPNTLGINYGLCVTLFSVLAVGWLCLALRQMSNHLD